MKISLRREAKIGLFALLTMVALYWGINYLRGQDFFKRNNTYYAYYDQVNGLQRSSSVTIRGLKVGVVSNIEYNPAVSDKILIELSIKRKYRIAEDSQARIFSDGLLGSKAIEIIEGRSSQMLMDGETIRSMQDKDFLEVAGSELEFVKQKVGQLVDDLSVTLASVNRVFAENAESLNVTMANLAQMSGSLNGIARESSGDLRAIISNINAVSAALNNASGNVVNIVGNVEAITDSLRTADFAAIAGQLTETLELFNETLGSVNEGEGTVGKLFADEQLYDSLAEAADNLATLLEDLRENPGRYVQFSVFGKRNR